MPTFAQSAAGPDHDRDDAARRMRAHERIYDPGTIRRLEALGVGPGWQCLEVGAGGGSITRWLCARVGTTGRVRALDLDTRFVAEIRAMNLDVARADIVTADLPADAYDLIHVRAVLTHLVAREDTLAKLVAALAPRGWLLVEEPDGAATCHLGDGLHRDVLARIVAQKSNDVADDGWSRDLPDTLHGLGLRDVGAESQTPMLEGGSPTAEFLRLTALGVREPLLASGASPAQLDEWNDLLDTPAHWFPSFTLMAAWGRRREG